MSESIPAGARSTPGTEYQSADVTIYRTNGQTVSKEEARGELDNVSLPSASLTVMRAVDGPDAGKSTLPKEGAWQVSTGALATRLGDKSENMVRDYRTLIQAMLKLNIELDRIQRKAAVTQRDASFALEIDEMETAAEEGLAAARARMITGVVVGSVTSLMGAVSIGGGYMAARDIQAAGGDANLLAQANNRTQQFYTIGQTGQSLGQVGSSVGEYAAAGFDKASKDADIRAKAHEHEVEVNRDLIATLTELLSSTRQIMLEINNAETEAGRSVARV
jgi:hypothetical protein